MPQPDRSNRRNALTAVPVFRRKNSPQIARSVKNPEHLERRGVVEIGDQVLGILASCEKQNGPVSKLLPMMAERRILRCLLTGF
jgi:hypothetical protein